MTGARCSVSLTSMICRFVICANVRSAKASTATAASDVIFDFCIFLFRLAKTEPRHRRGANPTHPRSRHREAPFQKVRQAAPEWARLGGYLEGKFAVFERARSQSHAKFMFVSLTYGSPSTC